MALFRLTQPFDAFHGTVSGLAGHSRLTLFASSKSAGVARKWLVPANPQTTNQRLVRGFQILAAAGFKALTQEQAAVWIAAAAQIRRENILHLSYSLSGINLFVMVNTYYLIHGLAIVPDFDEAIQPPTPTGITSVVLTSATVLTIQASVPGLEVDGMAMVRISPPLPSVNRKARSGDVRIVGPMADSIIIHAANVVTWPLAITSGQYTATNRIGIEVTPLSKYHYPGTKYLQPNIAIASPA